MKKQVKKKPEPSFHHHFVITPLIYPCNVLVIFTSKKEYIKLQLDGREEFKGCFESCDEAGAFHESFDGCVKRWGGKIVMWLRDFPTTPKSKDALAHEIFHCVTDTMRYVGMKHGDDSEEAYAYYNRFITRRVYEELDLYYDANSKRISRLTKRVSRTT